MKVTVFVIELCGEPTLCGEPPALHCWPTAKKGEWQTVLGKEIITVRIEEDEPLCEKPSEEVVNAARR